MRNSADLAAGSESVVREFLKSSGAVGRGAVRPSNHPFSRARRLQPERFLKSRGVENLHCLILSDFAPLRPGAVGDGGNLRFRQFGVLQQGLPQDFHGRVG